jgi:hypothetical protein
MRAILPEVSRHPEKSIIISTKSRRTRLRGLMAPESVNEAAATGGILNQSAIASAADKSANPRGNFVLLQARIKKKSAAILILAGIE